MSSLTFTALQKSSLSTATVSDTTYLSTSQNNTDVYNILTSIISQLQGNTTYLASTSSSTLITLYTLLQSLVQSLSITSYSGADTSSTPIIKQYYDTVYARYNSGGFTTQTTYLNSFNPTRANMLYTLWKLISDSVLSVSTLSGTTPTVQFNTTYMNNTNVSNLLQSVQRIIYIHNILLSDMETIHTYVNRADIISATNITIVNTDPYLNKTFPIIESRLINLISPSTVMLIGSAIIPLKTRYDLTNGLTHTHTTGATLPAGASSNVTTSLTRSTVEGSNQVYVSSTTSFSVGKFVAIGGTYNGSSYGGSSVAVMEYNYVTAVDTTNRIITLDAPIRKAHFIGSIIQCFNSSSASNFTPVLGCTTIGYSIIVNSAPSGWSSFHIDYIPNLTPGNLFYFDNSTVTWTYSIDRFETPINNQTLTISILDTSITQALSRLIIFYQLPDGQETLYPLSVNDGSKITSRTSSAISVNATTVSTRSTDGTTNASTKLIAGVSIVTVGTGSTKQTRKVTSVSSNTITVSPAFSVAQLINSFFLSYAIYSSDAGATQVGQSNGSSIPFNSIISTVTVSTSNVSIGENVLPVLSTLFISKGNYVSLDANVNNRYSHVVTSVDSVAKTITIFPPFTLNHLKNTAVQVYSYGDSLIPSDATLTYLSTQFQGGTATTTASGTTTLSVNGFMGLNPNLAGNFLSINIGVNSEYSVVSSNNSTSIELIQPTTLSHTNKIPLRFFTYPKNIPNKSILQRISTLNSSTIFGTTSIILSSVTNVTIGSIVIVDPAGTFEETTIVGISGNTCTISPPLYYPHSSGVSCIFYFINNLPTGASYKKYSYTSNAISSGQNTLVSSDITNINVGDYLQLENSSALNFTEIVRVTSINSGTSTLTVSPSFISSHVSGTIFQAFTMTIPPVPSEGTILHINTFSASRNANQNTIPTYNNSINTSSCVACLGTGSTCETVQVSGVNTTSVYNTTQTFRFAHSKFEVIVFYTMPFSVTISNANGIKYEKIYTTSTSAITAGSNVVPVFSIQNLAVGNYVMLKPNSLFYNQEFKQITAIGTNSITVSPAFDSNRVSGIGIAVFTYTQFLSPSNRCAGMVFPSDNSGFQGSNTINLYDASAVVPGQFMYCSTNSTPYIYKVVSKSGNTVTVYPKFNALYPLGVPIILFTDIAVIPPNNMHILSDALPSAAFSGDCFLPMTSNSNVYILYNENVSSLITEGVTRVIIGNDDRLVVRVGGNPKMVTLDAPLTSDYPVNYLAQYYNPPDTTTTFIPLGNNNGNTFITQTTTVQTSINNSPNVFLESVSGIFVGAGMSFKPNNNSSPYTITAVNSSNNSITLSANPSFSHPIGDAVIIYGRAPSYPDTKAYSIFSSYTTSSVSAGSNTIKLRSLNTDTSLSNVSFSSIQIGNKLCIGYINNTENDYIVTSVDYKTNTVTLDTTFVNSYTTGTLCQFYDYPTLPQNSSYISRTTLTSTASSTNVINVTSTAGMRVGHGVLVTANINTFESGTITAISGNAVTLSTTLRNSYSTSTTLIQTYITSPPSLPMDAIPSTITYLTSARSSSNTTITVANSSVCVANLSYVMIDIGNLTETFLITAVNKSTNVLTLSGPLVNSHVVNSIARIFSYPNIPSNSTSILNTKLFIGVSQGATNLTLYNTSGIVAGTTFLQIGSEPSIDSNKLVTAINGNVVTLDSGMSYLHEKESYVSLYTFPITLTGSLLLPTGSYRTGISTMTSNSTQGSTIVSVSSTVGISEKFTYLHITDLNTNVETNLLISSISGNNITINKPLAYSHSQNTVVEYFKYMDTSFDSTISDVKSLSSNYSSGSTTLNVDNSSGITANLSFISITNGIVGDKDIIVTNVNGNVITLGTALSNSYPSQTNVQIYSYPSIPVDTIYNSITFTQYFHKVGETSIFLQSTAGINPGMFLQIGSGNDYESDICVFGVTDNVLNISSLTKIHPAFSSVIVYKYDNLPSNYKMNAVRRLFSSVSAGTTVLKASNFMIESSVTSQATANYNYIQIGTGSFKENIAIQSINVNRITLATPLVYSHSANKSFQLYDLSVSQNIIDPVPIVKTTVKSARTAGSTSINFIPTPYLTFPSTLTTYADIGPNSSPDLGLVASNYTVSNTSLSFSPALINGYSIGDRIILYNYPVPYRGSTVNRYTFMAFEPSVSGATTFRVYSTVGISVGNLVKIGTGPTMMLDNVVTGINGQTITVRYGLPYNYPQYTSVLFYNYPAAPLGSTLTGATRLKGMVLKNTNRVVVWSTNGIVSGKTCVSIDSSTLNMGEQYLLVTDVNTSTNTLTLASNLMYDHLSGTIVQLYEFPDLPLGATQVNVTKLNFGYSSGATAVNINTNIGLIANSTYLQITNNTGGIDRDLRVSSVSYTSATLGSALTLSHPGQYPVQLYTYSSLPSGSTPTGITRLSSQATSGSSTINVLSATGITANTTYLQIDNGSLVETLVLVTAINGTTLTISPALSMNHVTNTSVQLFTVPTLPIDTTSVSVVLSRFIENVNDTSIELTNTTGITAGRTYLMIGTGSTTDNILITSVSGNIAYLFSPIRFTQPAGSLVQLYNYSSLPNGAIPIGIQTITSATSANATSIAVSSTSGIVANSTYLQIGSGSNIVSDVLVTVVSGLNLTLSKSIGIARVINTPIQLYTTLTYPPNVLSPSITQLSSSYTANSTTITVSSATNIIAGSTYVQLTSGASVQNSLVTAVNGNILTLATPFTASYTTNAVTQFYVYPPLPNGSTFLRNSNITQNSAVGATTLSVSSVSGIVSGITYVQIGSGSSLDTNILITGVNGNNLTLSSGLLYPHTTNEIVQLYTLSPLPQDTTMIGVTSLSIASSVGTTTLTVSSVASVVAGSTFLQLDFGTNLETMILITSVNTSTKTLTLSTSLSYSHSIGTVVQYYKYSELPQDSVIIGVSSLTSPISPGNNILSFSSILLQYSGILYAQIGSGSSQESNVVVSSTTITTATLSSAVTKSQVVGTSVQFYAFPPLPIDSTYIVATSISVAHVSGSSITLTDATGIVDGTYLQIGSNDLLERNLYVNSVSGNVVTLSSPLAFSHIVGTLVQAYSYPTLPLDINFVKITNLTTFSNVNTTTINLLSSSGIIAGKSYLAIGSGSSADINFLVHSVNGNTVTLSSPLQYSHPSSSVVQVYTYPDAPLDSSLVRASNVSSSYTTGTSLEVTSTTGVVAGSTYFFIGSGSNFVSNVLVTDVSGSIISFSSPLPNSYVVGKIVMFYTYPTIPADTGMLSITSLSSAATSGSTTITVSSPSEFVVDKSYLQIGSGSSMETNLLVTDVSDNVVTLSRPLSFTQPINSVVQNYKYSDLPSDTVLVGLYYTTSPITAGYSYVQLSSVDGLVTGSTYIQIGYGSNVETDLTITSINYQLKTVSVSPSFTYNHNSNLYIQAFTTVPLPIGATKIGLARMVTNAQSGVSTFEVNNVSGVEVGNQITIGSKNIYERDLTVTAIDTLTKTVTISPPFAFPHAANMPLQFYKYPDLPSNANLERVSLLDYEVSVSNQSVKLNTLTGISVGKYIQIGHGSTIENKIITEIITYDKRVLLNNPTTYSHVIGEPVQVYNYTDPSIPTTSGEVSNGQTRLSENVELGSNSISVLSVSNLKIGENIIIDVDTWKETRMIIDISGNVLTLNEPTSIYHTKFSLVIQYAIPPPTIPSIATVHPRSLVASQVSSGSNTMTVINKTNISIGTFLSINVGTLAETKLVIGISGEILTLDSNLSNNHSLYSLVQIYSFADPDLPSYANITSGVKTRISQEILYLDNYIFLPSVTGFVAGMYALIDVGNDTEVSLIVGIDTTLKKLYTELPIKKAHRKGSLIQIFDSVQPPGSTLVDHGLIYSYVETGKTQNNSLLYGENDDINVSSQFAGLMDSLSGTTDDLKNDTISLLTPVKALVDAKTLTGNMLYPTSASFIPYYLTMVANYGTQLPRISSFDLRPYVYGMWVLLDRILNTTVPGIVDGTITTLSSLTTDLAMFFNLYDNVFSLREVLDEYANVNGIVNYNTQPHLNEEFLQIPTVFYTEGLMIGAGINSLNEAGTIYAKNKPVLKPTQVMTAITASVAPMNAGINIIQVPPSTGVQIGQFVTIDIGLAQETCKVVGFGSLILDPPLKFPHPANTLITAYEELNNINFIINDFDSSMRLGEQLETEKEFVSAPVSSFNAYGTAPLNAFYGHFMFGTTDYDAYISGKTNDPISYTQDVTYFVDSNNWITDVNDPIIKISDFTCTQNHYNPSTFTSIQNPQLGILLSAVLCLRAFKIKDSQVLIKNHKEYADGINYNFANNIWNNVFYGLLWSQDFRRRPTDSLTLTDSFSNQTTYTIFSDLEPDPLYPNDLYCAQDKDVPTSISNKLMHQLAYSNLERLRTATPVPGSNNYLYNIPLIVGDKIIFKLKTKYSIDNVLKLFNIDPDGDLSNVPEDIMDLNTRFNEAINEHDDYISFTIHITLT